jgi:hypothetical protein
MIEKQEGIRPFRVIMGENARQFHPGPIIRGMAFKNRFFHEILPGLLNPIMPEMKAAVMR